MVLALLRTIAMTKGLRAALPFFEALVSRNPTMTARRILEQARGAGLAFRDTPAFQLVAQLKTNQKILSHLMVGSLKEVIPRLGWGKSVTNMTKNYSIVVKIRGYNPLTEKREIRLVTVISNRAMSVNRAFELAALLPSDKPGSQGLENVTYDVESALRSSFLDD